MITNPHLTQITLFKKSLCDFLNELIDFFPEEREFILLRIYIETVIPTEDILKITYGNLNANKGIIRNMIKNRNDEFFISHSLFKGLGDERVNHFKTLWTSNILPDERANIWLWIEHLTKLVDAWALTLKKVE